MMMMMMMMMVMLTWKSPFTHIGFSSTLGLKSLPHLSDLSCLKKLHAENCDIQSLPDNLFHYQLEEINLSRNRGDNGDMIIYKDSDDDDNDDIDNNDDSGYNLSCFLCYPLIFDFRIKVITFSFIESEEAFC